MGSMKSKFVRNPYKIKAVQLQTQLQGLDSQVGSSSSWVNQKADRQHNYQIYAYAEISKLECMHAGDLVYELVSILLFPEIKPTLQTRCIPPQIYSK